MNTIIIIYLIGVLVNLLALTVVFYKEYQEFSEITLFELIGGCIFACGSFPNFILVILGEVLDLDNKDRVIFKKE